MRSARAQVSSVEYTGNKTFGQDTQRGYLFVAMGAGAAGTIEFGNGGGKIPIAAEGFIEPYIVPTSEFTIECTGSYVVLTTQSTHELVT